MNLSIVSFLDITIEPIDRCTSTKDKQPENKIFKDADNLVSLNIEKM